MRRPVKKAAGRDRGFSPGTLHHDEPDTPAVAKKARGRRSSSAKLRDRLRTGKTPRARTVEGGTGRKAFRFFGIYKESARRPRGVRRGRTASRRSFANLPPGLRTSGQDNRPVLEHPRVLCRDNEGLDVHGEGRRTPERPMTHARRQGAAAGNPGGRKRRKEEPKKGKRRNEREVRFRGS